MKYIPLHDRIIVEEAQDKKRTAGGLWIPDRYTNSKAIAFGKVLGVGVGRTNAEGKTVPLQLKVGDVIAYPRKAPAEMPVFDDQGNEYKVLMLREADVCCIVLDMPIVTAIVDKGGAPLSMLPISHGKADSVYENQEAIDIAEREGWVDVGEHVDQ